MFNPLDADCGKGFVRFEDMCLLISSESITKDNIATKCSDIGATPLDEQTDTLNFFIKVSLL